MTSEQLNAVYSILVQIGGANEDRRMAFVYAHRFDSCEEWRFEGGLGFGGKYRIKRNRVDCYKEDETEERLALIKRINKLLELV